MFERENKLEFVKERVCRILEEKAFVLVGIDGRCASGKSTFGEKLAKELDANLLHMDDFFLRPEQRSEKRLELPGENVDHERFLEEVLLPLAKNEAFFYRPFDCETLMLTQPVFVPEKRVAVVEGSYCFHPALKKYYDLKIFLTVDKEEQMKRLIERNGDYAKVFEAKWIPLEEKYFSAFAVESLADFVF